jgi:hypothetical protein
MSRLFWSIFASLVIVTGTAQGVIDQRMDSVAAFVAQGNPINPVWHAQSFTVGMDGELSRINFPVHFNLRVPPSNWQFSWQIIRGDGATLIAGADGVLAAGTALAETEGHDSMVPQPHNCQSGRCPGIRCAAYRSRRSLGRCRRQPLYPRKSFRLNCRTLGTHSQ